MPTNPTPFRVAIVPGVNPGKWTRAWADRRRTPIEVTPIDESDQLAALTEGRTDVAFVRLPIDRAGLSVIRLYEEVAVVVVPREHPISLFDSVTTADLVGETIRGEPVEDAIDLVVAGAGIMLLPQSIARQHARRDLEVRPVSDAPATEVAIAWLADGTTPDVEEFVGIVRGRTAASSRGASEEPGNAPQQKPAQQKLSQKKPAQRKPAPRPRRGR